MAELDGIGVLLKKLEVARFTGTLEIRFEAGAVASVGLEHYLPFSELGRELPTVEPEEEFALKP